MENFILEIKDGMLVGVKEVEGMNLETVSIPSSVKQIGRSAFGGCVASYILIPNSVETINSFAFVDSNIKSITIPSSVKKMGIGLFVNCKNLEEVIFECKMTAIPKLMFFNSGLKRVKLPDSVTIIPGLSMKAINEYDGSNELHIELPNNLKTIQDHAFPNVSRLLSIRIPSSIEYIDPRAFEGCYNLTNVDFEGNDIYEYRDHCLIERASKKLVNGFSYPLNEKNEQNPFKIPSDLKIIGKYAFCSEYKWDYGRPHNGVYLKEIPSSIENIEDEAFYGSTIRNITIPSTVKKIGKGLFKQSRKLEEVILKCKIKAVPRSMFANSTLKIIKLPDSVRTIYEYAFLMNDDRGDPNADFSIKLSNNLKRIKAYAFLSRKGLRSIRIPDSIEFIDPKAFFGCCNLTNVHFKGNDIYEYRDHCLIEKASKKLVIAFPYPWNENSKKRKKFKIPSDIKAVGKNAFCTGYDCYNQESDINCIELGDIPASVEIIERRGLLKCRRNFKILNPNCVIK